MYEQRLEYWQNAHPWLKEKVDSETEFLDNFISICFSSLLPFLTLHKVQAETTLVHFVSPLRNFGIR